MQASLSRIAPVALAGLALSGVASAQEPDSPWTFFGQARLRAEFNDTNTGGADRHRQRIRLRAGASYRVNEELSLTARASTGPAGNPRSGYHDIGQGFNRMELSLDQMFLAYTPETWGGATVVAGKFANPVYRTPFYGELVWDADLMPEGAALVYPLNEFGPFDSSSFIVGHTAVIEQAAAEDTWATMFLWNGTMNQGDDSTWNFGVNYYFYGDLSPDGLGALVGTGNAVSGGDFASDFGVLQGTTVYETGDLIFSGEYILNTRAADGVGDSGFALGAGMDTEYGRFYIQHQTVEQDATVAVTAQDDFLYATNYSTNVVGWKKAISDATALHVWLQASELDDDFGAPDDTVYRFRIDFDVNF
ncbi:MAG: hypothetical protein CMJ94_14460 [Planctomycetes bacterium]|nr:hypothetical protein [Planctomycetota bacterium]